MDRVDTMTRGMEDLRALAEVEIPSMKDKVSEEEWAIRVDLAAAYRLVAHYGWDDLIFTHLSARIPGPEHHFLLNPYQLMFEEVTASSLVKVDVHGNVWCAWGGGEAEDGVAVYAPDGTMIGRILLPERCANVCFGGRKRNRLFMTASQSVYSIYVETQGVVGG